MVSIEIDIGQSPLFAKLASRGLPALVDGLKAYGAAIALSTLISLFSIAIYRLYFHPLSKYPGPWLAAITSCYFHYHMLTGDLPHHILKLHNKYGPVIRYAPNQLLYSDGAVWKDIYGHRTGGKQANARLVTDHVYPGHENLLQSETEENHGRLRRIFSNAFSEQALRRQEPMFKRYSDLLIESLTSQSTREPTKAFDMVNQYNMATFDVMGELTFNESLGLLENPDASPIRVQTAFDTIKANTLAFVIRQYSSLGLIIKNALFAKVFENRKGHLLFSEQRVDKRMATETDSPDIWNLVLNQKRERTLTKKEMYSNASMFMIAGTETVSTLLSGMTYWLIRTPRAMEKLRAELEEAFPGGQGISSEKLGQLKYLNACLEEALRIYPPVNSPQLRITPSSGATIFGDFVPPNTMIGVTQWAINHSERNFALPEEYHPERWLESERSDPRFINDNRAAKQSFSTGPRNCLGRSMAWFELRLIAAKMFLSFDMELSKKTDSAWTDQRAFTFWQKKPLMVHLTPRMGIDTATR